MVARGQGAAAEAGRDAQPFEPPYARHGLGAIERHAVDGCRRSQMAQVTRGRAPAPSQPSCALALQPLNAVVVAGAVQSPAVQGLRVLRRLPACQRRLLRDSYSIELRDRALPPFRRDGQPPGIGRAYRSAAAATSGSFDFEDDTNILAPLRALVRQPNCVMPAEISSAQDVVSLYAHPSR